MKELQKLLKLAGVNYVVMDAFHFSNEPHYRVAVVSMSKIPIFETNGPTLKTALTRAIRELEKRRGK